MRADREPPYAPEAEVSVLGGMLIDAEAIDAVADMLSPDMFHSPANRLLFEAMTALHAAGTVVDPTTLGEALTDSGRLVKAGGYQYLAELMDAVSTAANIEYHARIVVDRWQRRKLIGAGTGIVKLAHEPDSRSSAELVDAAEALVFECATDSAGSGLTPIKRAMASTFERLDELQGAPGGITGMATGWSQLDDMTGGLQPGELIIVAARPSMGKTGMMTGLALNAALEKNAPTAFFSFEMSKDQLTRRMLCHEAMVDLLSMNRGRLSGDDFGRIATAAGPLTEAPLWLEESGNTANAVRAACRRLHREAGGLGLVVIDYLGMMEGSGENRNHEVGGITRALKSLAKELDVPVVVGCQLSRANTNRSDQRPHLADLRDSGNIEQDADVVIFLHRPEYYMTRQQVQETGSEGKAEFLIRKQRNGPTGEIEMYFRAYCARFEEMPRRWAAA